MTSFTYGDFDSTDIDGLYVLKVERASVGTIRDERIEMPGLADAIWYSQPFGVRQVGIELAIRGDDYAARRAACVELAAGLSQSGIQDLTIDDETRYWRARPSGPATPDEWLTLAEIALDFDVQPYAYDTSTDSETWGGGAHSFTPSPAIVVEQGCVVSLTGATNPTIVHEGGTFSMDGSGTISVYALPGVAMTVTNAGPADPDGAVSGTSLMADVDTASVFPVLTPGTQSWTVTGATGVTVAWRRRSA